MTIQEAEESTKFGFNVTYDGDNHCILYGTECNRCGEYFESKIIGVYCDKCINEWKEGLNKDE